MKRERSTYPPEMWVEFRTAYAAGLSLRAMAQKRGVPVGTVLARAKREGWTREIEKAKAIAPQQSRAITAPGTATASVLADLGRESRLALGKGLHKATEHVASLEGAEIIEKADKVSSLAKASTTVFGWEQDRQMPVLRLELIAAASAWIADKPFPTLDTETGEAV